jgi:hypothetical protein
MNAKTDESHGAVAGQVERSVRPRLWVVRVVREAYVLADSEGDALEAQGEIERWEDNPEVTAMPDNNAIRLRGWDDDPERCVVYGVDANITLAEARRLCSEA